MRAWCRTDLDHQPGRASEYRPKSGFIEFPRAFEKRLVELGGQIRTRAQVERILVENGAVKGVAIKGGEIIPADYVITTVDPKLAMNKLVGSDIIRSLDPGYAAKVDQVRMSTLSVKISLGLDNELDLAGLGMDCGYNVITTGGDTFSALWDSFKEGGIGFNENRFHLGIICPSQTTGGKPHLTIRVVPMALGDWAEWRKNGSRIL